MTGTATAVTDLGVYDLAKARFTLRIKDATGLVWLTRCRLRHSRATCR